MKDNLVDYMSERYKKEDFSYANPGPVITISREAGCPAKRIAEKLANELNTKEVELGKAERWRWISKEILAETAKELNVDPVAIEYAFNYETRTIIEDVLFSHSEKYYKSDRKIRSTIAHVIRTMANKGHVVIVGRGSVAICHDIPRSLHIHLEAPLEWRVIMISEKYKIPLDQARKYAIDIDQKRNEFREFFEGKKNDYTWFDLKLNCMTFEIDEIVSILSDIIDIRKLL